MRRRPLGRTGLEVSELALGTWGLSGDAYGHVDGAEQDRVIDQAKAVGITLFDTAPSYGSGEMETKLGARLRDAKDALIVTKLGTDRETTPAQKRFTIEFLERAFADSATRLQKTSLDVVLLHNPALKTLERGDAAAWLGEQRERQRLKAWGISTSSADVARRAIELGAGVLSIPCNLFQQRLLRELSPELERSGIGLLGHSVLAYGLLAGQWAPNKEFRPGDHRGQRWTREELRKRVNQLSAVRPLIGSGVGTLRAAALRFVLHQPAISSAIIGPKSSLQLQQLVREAAGEPPYLPEEKLPALEQRLQDVGIAL